MCLACEMDALWFAGMEQLARATTPGSAGVPPALSEEDRTHFDEIDLSRAPSAPSPRSRGEGWGEGAFPRAQTRGEAPSPGMSAKDALIPTSPRLRGEVERAGASPAVPASPFLCEETRSE